MMAEVDIEIGGRLFKVACQEGEEAHLHSAASLLDEEATHLMNAAGRLPEPKMLLMAGLMLADKMAAQSKSETVAAPDTSEMEAQISAANAKIAELERALEEQASDSQIVIEKLVAKAEQLAQDISA